MSNQKRSGWIAAAQPYLGGMLGLLPGAVLGWFLGGMCITIQILAVPREEDRVGVSFFPMLTSVQEFDQGDGRKAVVISPAVRDVYIARWGHSDLATQVQIAWIVTRAVVGALAGALIGLLLDVRRLRRELERSRWQPAEGMRRGSVRLG